MSSTSICNPKSNNVCDFDIQGGVVIPAILRRACPTTHCNSGDNGTEYCLTQMVIRYLSGQRHIVGLIFKVNILSTLSRAVDRRRGGWRKLGKRVFDTENGFV